MNYWTRHFIVLLVLLLAACGGGDEASPAAVEPTGDPTQAARAFMTAFLNGNVSNCVNLSTAGSRESVRTLCEERARAQSIADLRDTTFTIVAQQGIRAVVQMEGSYRETVTDPETSNVVINDVENANVTINMEFEDDFWRFYNFE